MEHSYEYSKGKIVRTWKTKAKDNESWRQRTVEVKVQFGLQRHSCSSKIVPIHVMKA